MNDEQNTQFCQIYHGEDENPCKDRYQKQVWTAEKATSLCNFESPREFLFHVCAYISEPDPFMGKATLTRYISEYKLATATEKKEIAKAYNVTYDESLLFEEPHGRSIYKFFSDGGYFGTPSGILLYTDGRLFEETTERFGPTTYKLLANNREMGNAVKTFLTEHKDEVMALPTTAKNLEFLDGASYEIKFLSRVCKGYMLTYAEAGKPIVKMAKRVTSIIRSYGYLKEEYPLSEIFKENEDWDTAVPKIYPEGTNHIAIMAGIVKEPEATLAEHKILVEGLKKIKSQYDYEYADAILSYYKEIYSKRKGAPEINFNFNTLLKAYSDSTIK